MAQQFVCPNCGAPIDIAPGLETATCPFCRSQARLPEVFLREIKTKRLGSQSRVLLVVLLVIILVPTCIGLWGSIVGVMAGLLSVVVGILAPFFGR